MRLRSLVLPRPELRPGRAQCLGIMLTVLLCACPAPPAEPGDQGPAPVGKAGPPAVGGSESAARPGPQFVLAPETGEVMAIVADEQRRAEVDGRTLLVYVGASWCEPCQYFHAAADDGSLDATFPSLRLLEFDLDRDKDRLAAAGYVSRLIPLFVAPTPDGRAGPRRIEGGIKGPGALANLTPRLQALLQAASD